MGFDFGKFAQGVADSMQRQFDYEEENVRKNKVSNYTDDQLEYLLN